MEKAISQSTGPVLPPNVKHPLPHLSGVHPQDSLPPPPPGGMSVPLPPGAPGASQMPHQMHMPPMPMRPPPPEGLAGPNN